MTRERIGSVARPFASSLLAMLLIAASTDATATQSLQAATARQLLQRAIHLEEAVGDPEAAIATYEMVIAAPDADAPLTAVAEFRLATLLSAAGRADEARKHHVHITETYANDPALQDLVNLARVALADESRYRPGRSAVARRLWAGSAPYAFGALSPDGSFVSYVDWASGNLAVHDFDRGGQRFVTDLSATLRHDGWSSSVVSPDGSRIAYTWYSPQTGYQVRTVQIDGRDNQIRLSGWRSPRHVELASWSADGRDILAIVYVDESTHEFALIDTRNGTMQTVTSLGATASERARLSPNGRWIAFHQLNENGTHDVLLAATTSGATTTLVDHAANDFLPIWTADGRYVLFVSDRDGSFGAWIVEVSMQGEAIGTPQLVKADFGRAVPMGFTTDGALIYAEQVSMNGISAAALNAADGTLGDPVTLGGRLVGVNRLPQMSPDGRRMVYVSEPGILPGNLGPKVLTVRNLETRREHTLAPRLRRILPPRWVTDGALVAEAVGQNDQWGVYAINPDTSEIQLLAGWDGAICGCSASPVVSDDGSRLAYFRPREDGNLGDLVVRHLRTGAELTLVDSIQPDDVIDMDFSPEGDRLVTAIRPRNRNRDAGWRLQFLDVATALQNDVTSLGTDAENVRLSGWTDGDTGLLFVRAEGQRRSLGWVSADGEDLVWLILDLPEEVRGVVLHPGNDQLVFAGGSYRAEVWMLENPLAAIQAR
jgi:Tol biopolymer transport system component